MPEESQLWIATHSFGMLKEAKKLLEKYPGKVVFLNFDGYDFDDISQIFPESCDKTIWDKMIEISFDDYASFLSPETIVFCEGTSKGRKRKDFDAQCYSCIFKGQHSNTMFFSLGGCNNVEEKDTIVDFISKLSPKSKIVRLIDRDDRSPEEIAALEAIGIQVLKRRHIESYLLDDEVLEKWCNTIGKPEKATDLKAIKQNKIQESIKRGNAADDVKSASNEICTEAKKLLSITACGNSGEMIMRDTIAKLITPEMRIYKEIEEIVFG